MARRRQLRRQRPLCSHCMTMLSLSESTSCMLSLLITPNSLIDRPAQPQEGGWLVITPLEQFQMHAQAGYFGL